MNPDVIRIRVIIDDPNAPLGSDPQQVWLDIARAEFRDAFAPLPRDRELPFLPEARARAAEQRRARDRAAQAITSALTPAILEAMGKIDTINGYTPREWRQAHGQPE